LGKGRKKEREGKPIRDIHKKNWESAINLGMEMEKQKGNFILWGS